MNNSNFSKLPPRFNFSKSYYVPIYLVIIYFVVKSFSQVELSFSSIINSLPEMKQFFQELFPPDFSRIDSVISSLILTFQIALVGTILGIFISFPISIFASRTQSPNKFLYFLARAVVSLFRTVPDLIWAIFFVVTVGLGPIAGVLTIMVDTIGFCGRFFAEAFEEVDPGPVKALNAIGAGKLSTLMCAVIPSALPSLVNSSLFSLEKAVRSSVVLGLVGAGGIGVELKTAMDMFRFDEAATIILAIFILVLIVERVSSWVRGKIMEVG